MEDLCQAGSDRALGGIHALVERLHDEVIAVAVHHESRQQVAFAVHHAVGIAVPHDTATMLLGRAQAAQKEIAADVFHLPRQHAQTNLRTGAVVSRAQRTSPRVCDLDRMARLGAIAVGDIAGENPGVAAGHAVRAFAAHADFIHRGACRRAMRSSVEGWVEKRRMKLCPVKGLMMNMWAVDGEASMGICLDQVSSFRRPPIRGYGEPTYLALAASASNSREREMAICINIAAMGARIIMAIAAMGPPRSSSSRLPPNQNAMRARKVIVPATMAAMELMRISRCSTWPNSWAATPSSSLSDMSRRRPAVKASEACDGLRPVAKAFGESSGMSHSFGIGSPMCSQRLRTMGATRRYASGFSVSVTACAE